MSGKIRVTSDQYNERKQYLEKKYNKTYIDKLVAKKLQKLEVIDGTEVLIEPINTDRKSVV